MYIACIHSINEKFKKFRCNQQLAYYVYSRSSRPKLFLGKVVLKICSKFIGEHPCRSMTPIKLQSNFIEIALWH